LICGVSRLSGTATTTRMATTMKKKRLCRDAVRMDERCS